MCLNHHTTGIDAPWCFISDAKDEPIIHSVIEVLPFLGQSNFVHSTNQICRHWNIYKKTATERFFLKNVRIHLKALNSKGSVYLCECVFNTNFFRLGKIQVFHDVHKLIQALGQTGVELALFTYCWHCLAWDTKTIIVSPLVSRFFMEIIILLKHLLDINKLLKIHCTYCIVIGTFCANIENCNKIQCMSANCRQVQHKPKATLSKSNQNVCFHLTHVVMCWVDEAFIRQSEDLLMNWLIQLLWTPWIKETFSKD